MGVSGPPRRGFARLGIALRLGEGRLRLGEPVIVFMACHGLFMASLVTQFVIVCGLLWGHCMTCLRVSLLD